MTQLPVELRPDVDHFLRNGRPHQIISGALHYFRIPAELWQDRLARLKALGCNTVETYVAWNFHRPYLDRPSDFTGMRDLGRFLDLAAAADLDILVRPGPYICAEWDNGGLPAWLLDDHRAGAALRTSDPAYLDHVDRWFDELLPIIVRRQADRGGRVIGVQVENEYGSFGNDHQYLQHLQDGLLERGVTTMLFTSDGPTELMLSGGRVSETLATVNFGSRQREAFELLDRLQADADGRRAGSLLEIGVLRALAHQTRGDHAAAQTVLRETLDAAPEPEQYRRLLLDEGLATAQTTLIEPLTERELDVLRLLDTELTGPEIARRLYVSLNTLRTHTKRIFTKLGATNRSGAVRRARERGLL